MDASPEVPDRTPEQHTSVHDELSETALLAHELREVRSKFEEASSRHLAQLGSIAERIKSAGSAATLVIETVLKSDHVRSLERSGDPDDATSCYSIQPLEEVGTNGDTRVLLKIPVANIYHVWCRHTSGIYDDRPGFGNIGTFKMLINRPEDRVMRFDDLSRYTHQPRMVVLPIRENETKLTIVEPNQHQAAD